MTSHTLQYVCYKLSQALQWMADLLQYKSGYRRCCICEKTSTGPFLCAPATGAPVCRSCYKESTASVVR